MKKVVIIFSLLLFAAGCDKTAVSQPNSSALTANSSSTMQVITSPDLANFLPASIASTTPIPTTTTPSNVKVNVGQTKAQQVTPSPVIAQNPVIAQPTPTQIQQPAIVCNNISGGKLPAGWYSDGQGNCSPTSPAQQASNLAAEQQAAQAAQEAQQAAQQQASQQAAQSAAQAETAMYQTQYQAVQAEIQPLQAQASSINAYLVNTCSGSSAAFGAEGEECALYSNQGLYVSQYEDAILADFIKPVTTLSITCENNMDNLNEQIFQIKMNYAQQAYDSDGAHGAAMNEAIQQALLTAANSQITAINQQIQSVQLECENGITP